MNNKRIKELAIQAGLIAPYGSDREGLADFDYRKFAELIVQECGEIAYGTYWQDPEGVRGIHIKDAILENFGVEA